MSERDEHSILDMFLLAVLSEGNVVTPYDFARGLGISPGASIPALRRLLKQGLVEREQKGARRRRAFTLTRSGKAVLDRDLATAVKKLVESAPLDAESISRMLALCHRSSQNRGNAATIVDMAIAKCKEKALEAKAQLPPPDAIGPRANAEEVYLWVLKTLEIARWQAQASALGQIGSGFRSVMHRPSARDMALKPR